MQFTKQYLTEDIDDFSDSIFGDEPLDEVYSDEQVNEDNIQLNLFKDKIAEQTEKDYKQFIYGYPNRIADYLNKAYSAVVKSMPATDVQKKAKVCAVADFDPVKAKDSTAQIVGWECRLGKDLHIPSLDKAIASANKLDVNRYKGKDFCSIKVFRERLNFQINKDIVDEVNKAMHINRGK